MDRDRIQRREFRLGRRGYDPAAVDAHLRAVALAAERNGDADAAVAAGQAVERLDGLLRELDVLRESLERSGRALEDGLARLRAAAGGPSEPPPAAEGRADDGRAAA